MSITEACHAGERRIDERCVPAGVPPERCGEGFTSDERGGCNPILPPAACAPGLIAVPGDAACRTISPCRAVAAEADTQFVDASFRGAADGTETKPWPTIQEAVNAAAPGAIVSVAPGHYTEAVEIHEQPVRVIGHCAELVEVSAGAGPAAIHVHGAAAGSMIRGISIRSVNNAIGVGALDVVIEDVWIHDTVPIAIWAIDSIEPASFVVKNTLIEHTGGVYLGGATARFERSAIRDTTPNAQSFGRALNIESDLMTARRAQVTLDGVLIERAQSTGIFVGASDLVVERSVVRDTLPEPDGRFGRGVALQPPPGGSELSSVSIVSTVLERNHDSGLFVQGGTATIDATTIRDTAPEAMITFGSGISLHGHASLPVSAAIVETLIERNADLGLLVVSSQASVEGVLIRESHGDASGIGDAVAVVADSAAASVTISGSVLSDNTRAGVSSFGAALEVGNTAFECNAFHIAGQDMFGRAFSVRDLGGNACGCDGASVPCKALTAELSPPPEP